MCWVQNCFQHWFKAQVQSTGSPFPTNQRLYKYEICLEAFKTIMDLILQNGMGCLSVYGGGTLIHLYLVSEPLKCALMKYFQMFHLIEFKSKPLHTFFLKIVSKKKVQGIWPWSWRNCFDLSMTAFISSICFSIKTTYSKFGQWRNVGSKKQWWLVIGRGRSSKYGGGDHRCSWKKLST